MLARLSSNDYPALAPLKTRNDDDFTIALLDASSIVLDILTFHRERLTNESYLGTATQTRSLTELSRLIGYQPAPAVSAAAYLAFSLKQTPGAVPNPTAPATTIPSGTQVQSVPAQGQTAQTFELSSDVSAKPDWNALPVQSTREWVPAAGDFGVYLAGTTTQLQPGDLILIVGDERIQDTTSWFWDIRAVSTVTVDAANQRTWVGWSTGLGQYGSPSQANPRFHAFRQRAALFGYNAINPKLLPDGKVDSDQLDLNGDWDFTLDPGDEPLVDLDSAYGKITPKSWIALILQYGTDTQSPSGFISLYLVNAVNIASRSDYAMSAKISRATVDTNLDLQATYYGDTRNTSAAVQSEELEVAPQPLRCPLYGNIIDLTVLRPDLLGATVVALSGRRQKLMVGDGVTGLQFVPDDLAASNLDLNPGDEVTLLRSPPAPQPTDGTFADWTTATSPLSLVVEDANGRAGTVTAALSQFVLAPSGKNDPVVSECALLSAVATIDAVSPAQRPARAQLQLQNGLKHCYERATTTVNANVGLATHGQTVVEIIGSGNASIPNQSFALKQTPLTYLQAPTPSGRQSTLQVFVDSVPWTEVPTLYGHGPSETIYATVNHFDAKTTILTGDNQEGSIAPTGLNNLRASHRVGGGSAGNVDAATLTTLMDRPLSVNGVTNPERAAGGQDAQVFEDIRANAPQSVMTLGRAVSITDYQNFAATFAGISKAHAIWIPGGPGRGVFLTVAGIAGAGLPPGNVTLVNLAQALSNYGNPLIPITICSFLETLFSISASIKYDPAADPRAVETAVRQSLIQTFSFSARSFGQGIAFDEVCSVIQSVPGVVAVNVSNLNAIATSAAGDLSTEAGSLTATELNNWLSQGVQLQRPYSDVPGRICGYLPIGNPTALPQPAEIIVIHPDPRQVILVPMS